MDEIAEELKALEKESHQKQNSIWSQPAAIPEGQLSARKNGLINQVLTGLMTTIQQAKIAGVDQSIVLALYQKLAIFSFDQE